MDEMSAEAEPEPTFEAVLEALSDRPLTRDWAVRQRRELKEAFDDALKAAKASGDDLEAFSPEAAAQAIRHLARLRGNRPAMKFKRPCCSKRPFTYPFCDRSC